MKNVEWEYSIISPCNWNGEIIYYSHLIDHFQTNCEPLKFQRFMYFGYLKVAGIIMKMNKEITKSKNYNLICIIYQE